MRRSQKSNLILACSIVLIALFAFWTGEVVPTLGAEDLSFQFVDVSAKESTLITKTVQFLIGLLGYSFGA